MKEISILLSILLIGSGAAEQLPKQKAVIGVDYLGSLKLIDDPNAEEAQYYISVIDSALGVSWEDAEAACAYFEGRTLGLLSLESLEERDGLDALITAYRNGSSFSEDYWTSGKYDSLSQKYYWSSHLKSYNTTINFAPNAPWGSSEPFPIAENRPVGFRFQPGRPSTLRIPLAYNQFICESMQTSIPIPCYETQDIQLVLDSSGSVGQNNYVMSKNFVSLLASSVMTHELNRVGFFIYSSSVVNIVRLEESQGLTSDELVTKIKAAPYQGSGTPTDLAIESARIQFQNTKRPDIPQVMIVMTDGASDNRQRTLDAANRALGDGIKIFTVGITSSIDMIELNGIVGGREERIYTAANFQELVNLLTPVSVGICQE